MGDRDSLEFVPVFESKGRAFASSDGTEIHEDGKKCDQQRHQQSQKGPPPGLPSLWEASFKSPSKEAFLNLRKREPGEFEEKSVFAGAREPDVFNGDSVLPMERTQDPCCSAGGRDAKKKKSDGGRKLWSFRVRWATCALIACFLVAAIWSESFPKWKEAAGFSSPLEIRSNGEPLSRSNPSASNGRAEVSKTSNKGFAGSSNLFRLERKRRQEEEGAPYEVFDPFERPNSREGSRRSDAGLREIVYGMGVPLNEYLSQINVNITDLVQRAVVLSRTGKSSLSSVPDPSWLRERWCASLSPKGSQEGCFRSKDLEKFQNLLFWQVPFEEVVEAFFEGEAAKKPEEARSRNSGCRPNEDPACSRYAGAGPSPLAAAMHDASFRKVFLQKIKNELALLFEIDSRGYRCCCSADGKTSKCGAVKTGSSASRKEFAQSSLVRREAEGGNEDERDLFKNKLKGEEKWTCGLLSPSDETDDVLVFAMWLDPEYFSNFEVFRCGLQLVLDNDNG